MTAQRITEKETLLDDPILVPRRLFDILGEKHEIANGLQEKGIDPFVANCRAWGMMLTKIIEEGG